MQTIRWYRWLALGVMFAPVVAQAQGPQPIIKEIATIPGVDMDNAIRLPNGPVIIYAADDSIGAYNPTTKRFILIARGWDGGLAISPQGTRIAYARTGEGNDSDYVWSVPLDPTTGAPTGRPQRVSVNSGYNPSFSPDGESIAFERESRSNTLVAVPASGGAERALATFDHTIGETSWSADGRWVFAEIHGDKDSASSIARVPAAGGRSERVIAVPHPSSEGSIGGQIAFYWPTTLDFPHNKVDYVTAAGARGEISIAPAGRLGYSINSPHPLLFQTTSPTTLHVIDIADGKIRELTQAPNGARYISWSPDNKQVAYAAEAADHWVLVVMGADGTAVHHFPIAGSGPTGNGASFWSPDGSHLVYYSNNGLELRALAVATGKSTLIASFPKLNSLSWPAVWRAGGQTFLAHTHSVSPTGALIDYKIVEFGLDGSQRIVRDVSAEIPSARGGALVSDKSVVIVDSAIRRIYLAPIGPGPARPLPGTDLGPEQHTTFVAKSEHWFARAVYTGRMLNGIQLISLDGAPTRTLTLPAGVMVVGPGYLPPVGTQLMVIGRTEKQKDVTLFSVPLDGGPARVVATLPSEAGGTYWHYGLGAGWSTDGAHFAFETSGAPTTHIYDVDLAPVLRAAGIH